MDIKILGTGCSSCKALYEVVKQAVQEEAIEAGPEQVIQPEAGNDI